MVHRTKVAIIEYFLSFIIGGKRVVKLDIYTYIVPSYLHSFINDRIDIFAHLPNFLISLLRYFEPENGNKEYKHSLHINYSRSIIFNRTCGNEHMVNSIFLNLSVEIRNDLFVYSFYPRRKLHKLSSLPTV